MKNTARPSKPKAQKRGKSARPSAPTVRVEKPSDERSASPMPELPRIRPEKFIADPEQRWLEIQRAIDSMRATLAKEGFKFLTADEICALTDEDEEVDGDDHE